MACLYITPYSKLGTPYSKLGPPYGIFVVLQRDCLREPLASDFALLQSDIHCS